MASGSASSSRCSLYDSLREGAGGRSSARGVLGASSGRLVDDGERAVALEPIAVAPGVAPHLSIGLEHERRRDHGVEKVSIVAHDEQRAFVLGEPVLERFERLDVEIVRRLVEHEQVGGLREQLGEDHAIALAARQRRDRRQRALGGEQEVREIRDDVLLVRRGSSRTRGLRRRSR